MQHPKWITNYEENFTQLAEEIGDLRYDALESFLELLSEKIKRDAANDAARQRVKLAASLAMCAQHLEEAALNIKAAWRISKPHMKLSDLDE